MKTLHRTALAALIVAGLVACQKQDAAPAAPTAATPAAAEPAAPAPEPEPAAPADPAPMAAADSTGVAECDEYLTRYEACVSQYVPAEVQGSLKASLDATRAAWLQAAATPEGKASLEAACRSMRETTRQSLQAYGCTDF